MNSLPSCTGNVSPARENMYSARKFVCGHFVYYDVVFLRTMYERL